MNKSKNLIFFLLLLLLFSCSFDDKTGIWNEGKKEKRRIAELKEKQKKLLDTEKTVYLSDITYSKKIKLTKSIVLSQATKNSSWKMSGLNYQNSLGNIYATGIDKIFFKKKIGSNKFPLLRTRTAPLISNNNIISTDDRGTITKTDYKGKILWKINIYKKVYKSIYKSLNFSIFQNYLFVTDNLGFIYSLSLDSGKVNWIKNHGVPFKSYIKVYKNKIFIINQDNRILAFNSTDGSILWDLRSIKSFIKSQFFLSLAISQDGDLVALNSSGDLFRINADRGTLKWSVNVSGSLFKHATDFFKTSMIVIHKGHILFSAGSSFFSYDLESGKMNWEKEVNTLGTPIIDGKNIFLVTENGFFVIMEKDSGNIISSSNILEILKEKHRETTIKSFILGSQKIYSFTSNGFLIVSSATLGKVEKFKKIGSSINSHPIISNGTLFILADNSKLIGFN